MAEIDDAIRRAAGRRVPVWQDEEEFERRKPLEGEELKRETSRLFGIYLRREAARKQLNQRERVRRTRDQHDK